MSAVDPLRTFVACASGFGRIRNFVWMSTMAAKPEVNMKDYKIDKSEFSPSSMWSASNALHLMKLSYAVYAGTTDNIGASENWAITER